MGYRRRKRDTRRHFVGWRFPLSGSFQGTHLHFSGSKSEIYHGMHPTLDDSRVSSTIRSFRPKYCKITPETRSLHNFASQPWSFAGGESFKYSILENRLLRQWSSLFPVVLLVCLHFGHVPSLLPSNVILIRLDIASFPYLLPLITPKT